LRRAPPRTELGELIALPDLIAQLDLRGRGIEKWEGKGQGGGSGREGKDFGGGKREGRGRKVAGRVGRKEEGR